MDGLLLINIQPFTTDKLILAIFGGILLGTKSFDRIADDLLCKIKSFNTEITEDKRKQIQISFFQKYYFFTGFCKEYRETVKQSYRDEQMKSWNRTGGTFPYEPVLFRAEA